MVTPDTRELVAQIGDELRRRQGMVAVAESVTGGHLQALLTSISRSSEFFAGGVTAYQREIKVQLLHIDPSHAAETNCVSPRVAKEMAVGVCQLFDTPLGVATTGYAEPAAPVGIEQPHAYVAVCTCEPHSAAPRVIVDQLHARGARQDVQLEFARFALRCLYRALTSNHEGSGP
jgi:PncC family amidohydrolase